MFRPRDWFLTPLLVACIAGIITVTSGNNKTSHRRSRDFRISDGEPGPSSASTQYHYHEYPPPPPSSSGSVSSPNTQPVIYYDSPPGSAAAAAASTSDGGGYRPGPPPQPQSFPSSNFHQTYVPGPPPQYPQYSPPHNSGYRPGSAPYQSAGSSSSASQHLNHYHSEPHYHQYEPPPKYSSSGGNSLGFLPHLSPYHQSYSPVIYPYSPQSSSSDYLPGKPPSQYPFDGSNHHHHSPPYVVSSASASASATAGFGGSAATASASASAPGHGFSWGPPPKPPSGPPPTKPNPSNVPDTEDIYGWGPPPPHIHPPPYKPVPEFSHQFSLKPSSFGWETSYKVPCGNYKIQPRVKAHLRLATQAVLPKNSGRSDEFPSGTDMKRRKRDHHYPVSFAASFLDPAQVERSLHSYTPYENQPFHQPRPSFRPRTCRWNFNAVDGCKLNFKCGWFQLPALFRCDENYLHLTDNTILLDKTFCGNRRPRANQIFSSSSGKLALTFKSRGAALPAILDCTVLCTTDGGPSSDLVSPSSPSEVSTTNPGSPSQPSQHSTGLPWQRQTYPIIVHQHGLMSSGSTNKEQQIKNVTLIIKHPSPSSKPQLRMGNCKCGVPDSHYSSQIVHGRIVGGSSMMPGESPWTAAIVKLNSNRPYCGASLINNQFLLTAAHCVIPNSRKAGENFSNAAAFGDGGGSKTNVFSGQGIRFDVLLNEHDISQPNEIAGGVIRAKVDRIIVHPNYDNVTFNFDAALIRLANPIEFNSWTEKKIPLAQIYQMNSNQTGSGGSTLSNPASAGYNNTASSNTSQQQKNFSNAHRLFHNIFDFHSLRKKRSVLHSEVEARAVPPKPVPICLPDPTERNGRNAKNEEEAYAVVTGWGLMTEGGSPSNEMLKARVQIFNDSTCQELYKKHNYVITNSMMCAGYINGRIDSCVGDSGSPLATEEGQRSILTGMVSWGRGCGRKKLPGVYTKVTELMDWIYSEASSSDAVWCE